MANKLKIKYRFKTKVSYLKIIISFDLYYILPILIDFTRFKTKFM